MLIRKIYNSLYLTILILLGIVGCSPKIYNIPEYIKTPHAEEMAKFKNKKDVVMNFGAPDKSITFDSIEVIEYQLGQITNSKGVSRSVTSGNNQALNTLYSGTLIRNENPYYQPSVMNSVSNIVLSQYITTTSSDASSETIMKYAKFWLIGGDVMKWETQGIHLGKDIPNPDFDLVEKQKIESNNLKSPPIWQVLLFAGVVTILFGALL